MKWKTHYIDAKTPKGQASQVLRALRWEARYMMFGADITAEVRPYDSPYLLGYGAGWTGVGLDPLGPHQPCWQVVWEDGPYEWGLNGGSGGCIWDEELPIGYSGGASRRVPTFRFAEHVNFDHYFSFDIIFYR
jgi:hypothetical protein